MVAAIVPNPYANNIHGDKTTGFMCLNNVKHPLACEDNKQLQSDGQCVDPPQTTPAPTMDCEKFGFFPPPEGECSFYFACTAAGTKGVVVPCNSGEIYSQSKTSCVPEAEMTETIQICSSDSPMLVPDPNTTDCLNFYGCNGGSVVTGADPIPCPENTKFDEKEMKCLPAADVDCPANTVDPCANVIIEFGITVTTSPLSTKPKSTSSTSTKVSSSSSKPSSLTSSPSSSSSSRLQTPTDRAKCYKPEGISREGSPKRKR